MARFQKKKEKQNLPGYRTPDFFKGKAVHPKAPLKTQKIRFTQHKG